MCVTTKVTANTIIVRDINAQLCSFLITAASATSTLEVFDGTFGTVASVTIGVAGTGYEANDIVTLAAAGGGEQATVKILTVAAGVPQTIALVTGGTGYAASATYATTGGAGANFTVTVATVTDSGTSKGKISTVANTSFQAELETPVAHGISVKITGSGAVGYVCHE